jgi:hypothetical protein
MGREFDPASIILEISPASSFFRVIHQFGWQERDWLAGTGRSAPQKLRKRRKRTGVRVTKAIRAGLFHG